MSKKLYVFGLVAIMLFMVGCGKQETNKNTVTVYDQQLKEVDNVTEDLSSYVYDLYAYCSRRSNRITFKYRL